MSRRMASIFCDGACSGNGTARAYGGWAWAYWPGAARGEPAAYGAQKLAAGSGVPSTNQRAELTALLEAIRFALGRKGETVTIYTDSMYAINCTSKWGPSWARKGWTRGSGEPLQNLDLVKQLVALWRPSVTLQHVRGHQTGSGPAVHGNNWVDRAAVAAAKGEPVSVSLSPVLSLNIPTSDDVIEYVEELPPPAIVAKVAVKQSIGSSLQGPVKQTDLRLWFGGT